MKVGGWGPNKLSYSSIPNGKLTLVTATACSFRIHTVWPFGLAVGSTAVEVWSLYLSPRSFLGRTWPFDYASYIEVSWCGLGSCCLSTTLMAQCWVTVRCLLATSFVFLLCNAIVVGLLRNHSLFLLPNATVCTCCILILLYLFNSNCSG